MTYQNAKKHLDRLLSTGLVRRIPGFGRETDRGIAPVWKYVMADHGMETLVTTLGLFSGIAIPPGYREIHRRIEAVRSEVAAAAGGTAAVICVVGGPADGRAFILRNDRVRVGREDPDHPLPDGGWDIAVPEQYKAVTRVTKPHALLVRSGGSWTIGDNGSTGGTFVNSVRLTPRTRTALASGDIIDLSVGPDAARLLFVAGD
jgi:hypothetical protein